MTDRQWLWPVRIVLIAALLLILFSPRPVDTPIIGGVEKVTAYSFPTFSLVWGEGKTLEYRGVSYTVRQFARVRVIYRDYPGKHFPELPVDTRIIDSRPSASTGVFTSLNFTWSGSTKTSPSSRDFGVNYSVNEFALGRVDCWVRQRLYFQAASEGDTVYVVRGDLRHGCD